MPNPVCNDPQFAPAIVDLTQRMRDLVLLAAAEKGTVSAQTHYADGYWKLEVHPNGAVYNDGYAEETRGRIGRIEQLSIWELSLLIETL